MSSFGEPGIQAITLWLSSVTAVLSLGSVVFGLFCTVRGKDPLPRRVRSLLRRIPASAEDFRLRGMSLMLNGAAVMLLVSLFAVDIVDGLTYGGGYGPAESLVFPTETKFLVITAAVAVALALLIASYALSLRIRYVSTRLVTGSGSV